MSEDHIKTVVMDTPPAKLEDEEKSEECRSDQRDEGVRPSYDAPGAPAGSWLS